MRVTAQLLLSMTLLGVDEAREEVEEIVQFLREPERFVQVGARIPKRCSDGRPSGYR